MLVLWLAELRYSEANASEQETRPRIHKPSILPSKLLVHHHHHHIIFKTTFDSSDHFLVSDYPTSKHRITMHAAYSLFAFGIFAFSYAQPTTVQLRSSGDGTGRAVFQEEKIANRNASYCSIKLNDWYLWVSPSSTQSNLDISSLTFILMVDHGTNHAMSWSASTASGRFLMKMELLLS